MDKETEHAGRQNVTIDEAKERQQSGRSRMIIHAGVVGIFSNLLLVVVKLTIGLVANSIAIIVDAVNNATDVLSSLITIIGTKLAGRRPDRKHPFGYGRVEYLTSVAIGVMIVSAGVLAFRESLDKIIHPAVSHYTTVELVIIGGAILLKLWLSWYFKSRGRRTDSSALTASGADSLNDALLSAGTLVAALALVLWGANIDGIVGLIISLFVVKTGVQVLVNSLNPIIGESISPQRSKEIISYVASFPKVKGAYDLFLDDFGPAKTIGSIHIEVDDDMRASEIHRLSHDIMAGLYSKFGIIMTIGIYASNSSGEFAQIHNKLTQICAQYHDILQVHGFFVDTRTKTVYYDIVVDFKADPAKISNAVVRQMKVAFPAYHFSTVIDTNYDGL